MNLMPQSGHVKLGQFADELADVGHDQALDDRVQRQVAVATPAGSRPALRAQDRQRWSSRRWPLTGSVRCTEASFWHR